MKVRNMISEKSGREIPNQFVIYADDGYYFQSYRSIIAKFEYTDDSPVLILDKTYWDYSRTTSKYRNQFTGLSTEETKKLIRNGEIKLEDLNV